MNAFGQYFEWHYLPFIISFLFSLIMISVAHLGDFHGGHDAAGHAHGLHHDAHAHHDGHHHHSHHGHEKSLASGISKGLAFFGVGRLPLSLLISCAGLIWGLIGFISNMLLQPKLASPIVAFLLATGIASISTLTVTHFLGRVFIKIFPPGKEGARQEVTLLGELGTVQSTITAESGTVLLQSGNDTFRVNCRIHSGETDIPVGERVQLFEYEPTENLFYCHTVPAEQLPKQKIQLLERS